MKGGGKTTADLTKAPFHLGSSLISEKCGKQKGLVMGIGTTRGAALGKGSKGGEVCARDFPIARDLPRTHLEILIIGNCSKPPF